MYVIESDELFDMDLVGLPIRVEHMDHQDVGRVTSYTPTPDGRGYVEFEVSDDAAGWVCADLIRQGRLGELSLKHSQDSDGKNKRPIEVSLVARGARPGTKVYPCRPKARRDYISGGPTARVAIMASSADLGAQAAAMEDAARKIRESIAAGAQAQTQATQEQEQDQGTKRARDASEQDEAAKRARGTDGRFSPPAPAAEQQKTQEYDISSILDKASSDIRDSDVTKQLYGAVSHLMRTIDAKQTEVEKLQKIATESKGSTRTMAKQIATVLDGIYRRHANTHFDDKSADILGEAMMQFPQLGAALQPIMVSASDIERQLASSQQKRVDDQLEGYKAQVASLSTKIGQYQRMGGQMDAPAPSTIVAATGAGAPAVGQV